MVNAIMIAGLTIIVGLLLYLQRLREALKNKEFEVTKAKLQGEINGYEKRIKEAGAKAASSLERYRKLKSERSGKE